MKRLLSLVLPIFMIMLIKTQHCRSSEADSWDLAISSEINRTTSYRCTGSIHDCIAPEADPVMDHAFRRMLQGRNPSGRAYDAVFHKDSPACAPGPCTKPQEAYRSDCARKDPYKRNCP